LVGAFRIGYVPLIDAAPLLVAEVLGLYSKWGVAVSLSAELGWGSIREKLVYGELEAAHAPGPLLFSILLGTHSRRCGVTTDLVLSLQGNAITLSRRFWDRGVRDAHTLRLLVRGEAPHRPAFAVVARFSSHHFLLRNWLRSAGLDPERDVRIVVLPPPLVVEHMSEGKLTVFAQANRGTLLRHSAGKDGWLRRASSWLQNIRRKSCLFAMKIFIGSEMAILRLRSAILEAGRFCDQPENRQAVVDILQGCHAFPVTRQVLMNSLVGPFIQALPIWKERILS